MSVWAYTFISVIVVSLLSLVGVFFLSLKPARLGKMLLYLVSFAVGGLFGDAIIHLIPESFENIPGSLTAPMLLIGGILLFFIVEKVIRWRHCHVPTSEHHLHPVVTLNLVGDGVHNFIDGMVIGASYLVSIPIGLTTTLAVVLHEIPQEIGDFGILVHGGLSTRKAIFVNLLSAMAAVLGGLAILIIGPHIANIQYYMLPVTAGGFIYIAGSDLIPELHNESGVSVSIKQFAFIALGIGLMAALILLEGT
jgi:zinc and cadmium transporter